MTDYRCSDCGKSNIKLWRGYSRAIAELRCVDCTCKHEKVKEPITESQLASSDSIKWSIPAVPAGPNAYWGYTEVPQDMVRWWHSLPLRA